MGDATFCWAGNPPAAGASLAIAHLMRCTVPVPSPRVFATLKMSDGPLRGGAKPAAVAATLTQKCRLARFGGAAGPRNGNQQNSAVGSAELTRAIPLALLDPFPPQQSHAQHVADRNCRERSTGLIEVT